MMTSSEMKREGYTTIINNNMYGSILKSKDKDDPKEFATEEEMNEYIQNKIENK